MKSEESISNMSYENLSNKPDLRTLVLLTPEKQKHTEYWEV